MAATVIDSLLITLGLDTREYEKNQKRASDSLKRMSKDQEEQTKKIAAQSKLMADGFNKVKSELLALGAIAAGAYGLKSFFANMVATQAGLGRTAYFLGESAKSLDAWGAAAESVGGNAAGIQQSMQNLQGALLDFSLGRGGGEAVSMLRALNVETADAKTGKMRSMTSIYYDLAEAMKRLKPQEQLLAGRALGMDQGTINLLIQGGDAVKNLHQQMIEASAVSEQSVKNAEKAQKKWAQFKRELYGVGQAIFDVLSPSLDKANDGLVKISTWISGNKGEIAGFFQTMVTLATAAAKSIGWIAEKLDKIEALKSKYGLGAGVSAIAEGLGFDKKKQENLKGKVNEKVGEFVARVMAYGGDTEANDALAQMGVKGYTKSSTLHGVAKPKPGGTSAERARMTMLEKQYGLPAGLLDRVWATESGRGKNMRSGAGATGHFQFKPDTARQYGLSTADTYDFNKSSEAAAKMLSYLRNKYSGDMQKVMAAYNWGEGKVDRLGVGMAPAETRNYWQRFSDYTNQRGNGGTVINTQIGNLTVQTQATDAAGIARDLPEQMKRNQLLYPASTGMY